MRLAIGVLARESTLRLLVGDSSLARLTALRGLNPVYSISADRGRREIDSAVNVILIRDVIPVRTEIQRS